MSKRKKEELMVQENSNHYTRDEILSQPEVWANTLTDWQDLDIRSFPNFTDYDQALFIGCGSTYFISRWAARLAEALAGTISRAAPSSDILLNPQAWLTPSRKTLLVASSRSAETTETIKAINKFKAEYPGDVVVITCNPDKTMGFQSEYVIDAVHAQENSIAQTRSFSSMMLGHALLIERAIPADMASRLQASGQRLLGNYKGKISQIAKDQEIQRFFILGSGALYGIANEAMLKLKEVSLSYSESFHVMEFRHGPMSMVDSSSLVVGLLGDSGQAEELAVLREMKKMGARTMVITDSEPENVDAIDDLILIESDIPLVWRSPLYLPVLQWLAYERGLSNGLNPDRPNNLDAVVVLNEQTGK